MNSGSNWLSGATSAHVYIDETKAKGYVVVAATGSVEGLRSASRELGNLVLPGQRSLHMRDESDSRRREIADTILGLMSLGFRAVVYDAGRQGVERPRRNRCLSALLSDVDPDRPTHLVFDLDETSLSSDRQLIMEHARRRGLRQLTYAHAPRHQEPLLAIPDAIAWCWARGGMWKQRIRPIVTTVREV